MQCHGRIARSTNTRYSVTLIRRSWLGCLVRRAKAQRVLAEFRLKRRSVTSEAVAAACTALEYEIDRKRGKGSHWVAFRAGAPPVTIPTGNKVLGLKTATGILTVLEEVFERDGSNEQRQR